MSHDKLLAEALQLPADERIRLVQDLWDSIAEIPDALPLTEEHRAILEERLAAYHRDPEAGIPWEDVKAQWAIKFKRP